MSGDALKAIGFVFALVSKQIRTNEELQDIPQVVIQVSNIRAARVAHGRELVGLNLATSTYRATRFTDTVEFQGAVSKAKSLDAFLIVGDIFGSMRHLDLRAANQCFDALDRAEAEIVNAIDGRRWKSLSAAERQLCWVTASRDRAQRSRSIKRGLTDREARPKIELAARQKRGAAAGARNADRRARAIADTVRDIQRAAEPGAVSDTQLARELNDRGVQTPRGARWTPATARRLRLRLNHLGLINE